MESYKWTVSVEKKKYKTEHVIIELLVSQYCKKRFKFWRTGEQIAVYA